MKKSQKKLIIVSVCVVVCIVILIVAIVSIVKSHSASKTSSTAQTIASDVDTQSSANASASKATENEKESNTDSESSDSNVIKPIDCNPDFWRLKLQIAECYDHIWVKNHMDGTTYYCGTCDDHDATEIHRLAKKVKLYRDENEDGKYSYSVILPEIGWKVNVFDEKIWKIIDAQIAGTGGAYPPEEVAIVFYYFDNTIQIETAD